MLKCRYCGTETTKNGVKFINQGSLNLHELRCSQNPDKENIKNLRKKNPSLKDSSCEHEFLFLESAIKRANDITLKKALQTALVEGYHEVCIICGEVK